MHKEIKILYLFHNIDSMMYRWQIYHMVDELKRHNIFIDIIAPEDYANITLLFNDVIVLCASKKYDLFMTCLGDDCLEESFLKKISIKKLLFCPDNLVAPFNHKKISKFFDLVWLTSKETEYMFKRWKANTIFMPYAANPYYLQPAVNNKNESEKRICFVGTPHGSRIRTINKLIHSGIPVTIFSHVDDKSVFFSAKLSDYVKILFQYLSFRLGWRLALASIIDKIKREKLDYQSPYLEIKEPVHLSQVPAIYGKYSLILSFSEANSTGYLNNPVDIVNLRNFEVPMTGGIQFVRRTDELSSYFEDGESIIMYDNYSDMIIKAREFLNNTTYERETMIRISARKKAEEKHTWFKRFEVLLRKLEIYD